MSKVSWKNPHRIRGTLVRHVVVCVAWEAGLSPESIDPSLTLLGSSQRPPEMSNKEIYSRARKNIPVKIPTQSFQQENLQASILFHLLLSGKIHWAQSCELLAKAYDSSLSHK